MPDNNLIITDANYRENLERMTGVVLFYKELCPNCKAIEKMLEKFFAANSGIPYLRIDSEHCPEAMKALGVERVPTILVLRNGEVAAGKVGLMNPREMTALYYSA